MGRSTLLGAGTGGLLLPAIPRFVTSCTIILAVDSSTAITTSTGTSGSSSGVLGHPSALPYSSPPELPAVFLGKTAEGYVLSFAKLSVSVMLLYSSAEAGFVGPLVGHFVESRADVATGPDELNWVLVVELV